MADVLNKELQAYFEQLNEPEKKSVLLLLKTFLGSRKKNLQPFSLEQYNQEIDEALEEEKAGNYLTQEEMEKHAAKW